MTLLGLARAITTKQLSSSLGRWILRVSVQLDALLTGSGRIDHDWYVNSATGNDSQDGTTAGTAIKSLSELSRRISGHPFSRERIYVYLTGDFLTEALGLLLHLQPTQRFVVRPLSLEEVANGAIVTYTPYNAGTDSSATIAATISFSGRDRLRLRLVDGTEEGATAWVLKDLGGNLCRVSAFVNDTGEDVLPTNGDSFVVERYPVAVGGVQVQVVGGGSFFVSEIAVAPVNSAQVNYIIGPALTLAVASLFEKGGGFDKCLFSTTTSRIYYGVGFNACAATANLILINGEFLSQYSVYFSRVTVGQAALQFQGGLSCFEGGWIVTDAGSAIHQYADLQVFASQGLPDSCWCTLTEQASYWKNGALFGGANTFSNVFLVKAGCAFVYEGAKPTLVGSNAGVNDIKVGGVDFGWNAVPTISAANNAMAVPA